MEPLPKEFYCPITQELMKDPVIGPDGQTYERSAIVDWLKHHGTSPITREPMDVSQLVPNRALKVTIEDMLMGKQAAPVAAAGKVDKLANASLDLSLSLAELSDNTRVMHVSVVPPKEGSRHPCVFVCVLDVSGSMDEPASEDTGVEASSFSRLDLVKHSVKTIVHMLGVSDYLSLISFNGSATVDMELTQMNATGRKVAISSIDALVANGGTNIWDALRMSINLTRTSPTCNGLNTCILLFTDGEPNVNPPRGIIPSLNNLLRGKELNFSLHTFGYGYQLDSELLLDISRIGRGCFNYIPDCTMVGTIFVNFLSNMLATAARNATLEIKAENVASMRCLGCDMLPGGTIDVGTVQYGQSRDFVIQYEKKTYISPNFEVKLHYKGKTVEKTAGAITMGDSSSELYIQLSRCMYLDLLMQALGLQISTKAGAKLLPKILDVIKSFPTKDDERMKALARDLDSTKESEGQVTKAFSKADWFDKWGKHYIRSLVRAHQLQQCHNFKDPGVQVYGGSLFKELQDKTDEIFCTLPAPKPSVKSKVAPKASAAQYYAPPPADMSQFMNYGGGCFDGAGLVRLRDGTVKKVCELVKGDWVANSEGNFAKVIALVAITVKGEIEVVDFAGVKVTPWHPVKDCGVWKFPKDIKPTEKFYCDKIYNLVLNSHHMVTINCTVNLVTLGHGMTDNAAVSHAYFGTERVLQDLARFPGWESGVVDIEKWVVVRDPATGLVSGIQH